MENFQDYDKIMAVFSSGQPSSDEGEIIVNIECCEYPRACIELGVSLNGVITEDYITYYAGRNPRAETLDHVFYSPKDFKVKGLVPSYPQSVLGGGIPSQYFPSDHISVVIDFDWLE